MNASVAGAAPAQARIGPNAITQVALALQQQVGRVRTRQIFVRADLVDRLDAPPQHMVEEREVIVLHHALRQALGPALALRIADEAGRATARYLLAHRIPRPIQWLLRILPARPAARLLLSAITRHAWTFAGSGHFSVDLGPPIVLSLGNNPMCRGARADTPSCAYYAATFEHLFRTLVHPQACVAETACEASGADACRFEIRW